MATDKELAVAVIDAARDFNNAVEAAQNAGLRVDVETAAVHILNRPEPELHVRVKISREVMKG